MRKLNPLDSGHSACDFCRIALVHMHIATTSPLANSSMAVLHLRHNVIAQFSAGGLEQWRHLATLDLAFNALRSIDASAVPWDSPELKKVLVHDNPWDCEGCTNSWLISKKQVIEFDDRLSIRSVADQLIVVHNYAVQYC